MVEGHAIGDASSAIMADQREGRKSEMVHHLNQFLGHRTLGIRIVVVCRSGCPAATVSAQVDANHSVIPGKLGCEKSPHQTCAREAVHHQNCRPTSVAAYENRVSRNFDNRRLERILASHTSPSFI